ncbi:PhzF family phenazine biosynthesis protein [Actinopolymorpha singaporensis]|uniref:Trans-2,3-dihydro-3-hydroxyanthranilate isomerase n=1 Tax=Actinopolymorpha singaporensis TaxID=117157 RepID=A0A1H1YAA8_9ACTN|nr:PhzF family phenazine biosynthesis protein [Actinopolymorpha singaporensis]SDT18331.1 trans-2,3-dihydro-3-hydroxyanthranilate isomerase [Actinopolymorpha singaporensis]
MPSRPYEIVDVFTDRPYAGNPLAVVLDAEVMSGEVMQTLAKEFNLSETAFVLPPESGGDYRVRIFTPGAELPFAGHPSVGTAATLARLGRIRSGDVVQECGAGNLPVHVDGDLATITGGKPVLGSTLDPGPLLAAAGLGFADLLGPPAQTAAAGVDHVFLPVIDEAVARASLDSGAARAQGVKKVYLFSWDADRREAHARLFAPELGIAEDPATGSAALALGVWLVGNGLVPGDGETAYTVVQGAELGRPSRLDCVVRAQEGQARETRVTGQVAPVAAGEIRLPD